MSDSAEYMLRWRGRQSGPYSIEEMNRLLDDHQIGLGHEIHYEDQWISLEEFLAFQQPAAPAVHSPEPKAPVAPSSPSLTLPAQLRSSRAAAPLASQKHEGQPIPLASERLPARSPRRRLVYALLGIVLGFTGLHNYYARHWLTGLLQLLLSIATLLLGFGVIAPWLWAMVEAVVVRKDGLGLEML